jgi:hypothetical protein
MADCFGGWSGGEYYIFLRAEAHEYCLHTGRRAQCLARLISKFRLRMFGTNGSTINNR